MKLQFGSIIVQGAGKINGHQIRNFRGMPFLTKKAIPTKSNLFLANPAKKAATIAFKYWATLDKATRDAWSSVALTVPFLDRWGNVKYLTGRDFVTYLFINSANASISMPDPSRFDATIPSFTSDGVGVNLANDTCNVIHWVNTVGVAQLIYISQNPTAIRELKAKELKLITVVDLDSLSPAQLFTAIKNAGFNFSDGMSYSFGIKNISSSAMASPMQVFQVVPQV
jgi:hypothetical protein